MEKQRSTETTSQFAQELKTVLDEKGWTQSLLARKAGLERGTVWRYVHGTVDSRNGKVNRPGIPTIKRIAEVLGDGDDKKTSDYHKRLVEAAGHEVIIVQQEETERGASNQHKAAEETLQTMQKRLAAVENTLFTPGVDRVLQKIASLPPNERDRFIAYLLEAGERFQEEQAYQQPSGATPNRADQDRA